MRIFIEFVGGSWDGEVFDLDDEFSFATGPKRDLSELGNLKLGTRFVMPTIAATARLQDGGAHEESCEQWRLTDREDSPDGLYLRCVYLKPCGQ
jgi:hypothetical protein